MPALYDYRIFISHAWKYGEDYDRLVSMLDHSPWFSFYNYSAPQEKPLALSSSNATDAEIEQAITAKIKNAQVVLVIGGMYELYHKWMKYEVDEAMRMGKPIIAIMPWAQSYMPVELQAKATQIVGWTHHHRESYPRFSLTYFIIFIQPMQAAPFKRFNVNFIFVMLISCVNCNTIDARKTISWQIEFPT